MTLIVAKPTPEEVRKEMKAMRSASAKILASKESARTFLQKQGYITRSGKLTKRYGG